VLVKRTEGEVVRRRQKRMKVAETYETGNARAKIVIHP